ncbi:RmlC-like cupin domain-containing protein [Xylariaceae sp. AK1471]|nr:RmlC-like cupin domain-containing protein [Xylariaceae sp. AK1471]
MTSKLTPLKDPKVLQYQIPAHGLIPNTSIQKKPLLIYKSAFPNTNATTASGIESHLAKVGVVTPQWRYTMYSTSHFHSTSHEVLVVAKGKAKLCFGHEENEGRAEEVVERGDVVVVPAGVAHRLLEDLGQGDEDMEGGGGFEMVGAYPAGCTWDMCYGREGEGEEEKVEGIKALGWFERDPLYGDEGPVLDV